VSANRSAPRPLGRATARRFGRATGHRPSRASAQATTRRDPPGHRARARPDRTSSGARPTHPKRQNVKLGPNRARRGFASRAARAANSQKPLFGRGFSSFPQAQKIARRQAHTTSPSAAIVSRPHALCRSRIHENPPCNLSRARRCRVHRIPCPTSVTIAIRPSVGRDTKSSRCDLGSAKTEIFLQRGLDCPNQTEKSQQIALAERAAMWLAWPR
jgi:hypothetical protein